MATSLKTVTAGFGTDEMNRGIVDKAMEKTDRIRPTTNTRDDGVGKTIFRLQDLLTRFVPDDSLEVPNHLGEGMWAGCSAKAVVRVIGMRYPKTHGLVDGILKSLGPDGDSCDLSPQ